MKKFIFDVDGTLTPSRKQMHTGFSAEFLIFCCKFDTYLVTGSDKDKGDWILETKYNIGSKKKKVEDKQD